MLASNDMVNLMGREAELLWNEAIFTTETGAFGD
jgi:hypothetical protein